MFSRYVLYLVLHLSLMEKILTTDAAPSANLKCPHCLVACYMPRATYVWPLGHDSDGHWWAENRSCPNCGKVVVWLARSEETMNNPPGGQRPSGEQQWALARPKASGRPPVPPEVPEEYATDYREACLVIADSPKASAALSRRCLQLMLRKELQAEGRGLFKEIQWTIQHGNLPSSVIELLDVPRKVGNEAAHPTLSDAGLITDIEPWEAKWCLEIIESLYDQLFVLPAKNQERLGRLGQQQPSGS